MTNSPSSVLDASALIAVFNREPGWQRVASPLSGFAISTVNWSEVLQKRVQAGLSTENLQQALWGLGVTVEPFTSEDAEKTAALWFRTKDAGLSLADRACLALAIRLQLPVLTADRAWRNLDIGVRIELIR